MWDQCGLSISYLGQSMITDRHSKKLCLALLMTHRYTNTGKHNINHSDNTKHIVPPHTLPHTRTRISTHNMNYHDNTNHNGEPHNISEKQKE